MAKADSVTFQSQSAHRQASFKDDEYLFERNSPTKSQSASPPTPNKIGIRRVNFIQFRKDVAIGTADPLGYKSQSASPPTPNKIGIRRVNFIQFRKEKMEILEKKLIKVSISQLHSIQKSSDTGNTKTYQGSQSASFIQFRKGSPALILYLSLMSQSASFIQFRKDMCR